MSLPHRAAPSRVRCACCETLSPQRFQLLFSLWGWDQPSLTVPYTLHREAPRWGASQTAAPAKRVALATRVAPLLGISRSKEHHDDIPLEQGPELLITGTSYQYPAEQQAHIAQTPPAHIYKQAVFFLSRKRVLRQTNWLGAVAHTCNPSTLRGQGRWMTEGQDFETSLANTTIKKISMTKTSKANETKPKVDKWGLNKLKHF
ncbi:hypothetical protein AAY473_030417 [Plecturocebus cupreus]